MINDTIVLVSKAHISLSLAAKDSIIQDLIHNLTKRVDAIDNMDYKFWITILTPIILTFINLLIVRHSYKKDKERNILSNMSIEFDATGNRFIESYIKEDETELLKRNKEDVLNKIESMCYQYNKRNVNKNDFNFKFKAKIDSYYETYKVSYGKHSSYDETKKYYNKFHKTKTQNKICIRIKRIMKTRKK